MNWKYKNWQKKINYTLLLIAIIGLFDSIYLSYEKLTNSLVACSILAGCNTVINSDYAYLIGIPLAYLGIIYYLTMITILTLVIKNKRTIWLPILMSITLSGFLMSGYFVYLQFFEIGAICIYCMLSAITSTLIFFGSAIIYLTKKND